MITMEEKNVIDYLTALIQITGRNVFPEDILMQIVMPPGSSEKQLRAYNLLDGTLTQTEICKALKIDKGSFSRTVSRWISLGVVFKIGEGKDKKLLHVYPLPENNIKKISKRRKE